MLPLIYRLSTNNKLITKFYTKNIIILFTANVVFITLYDPQFTDE